MLFLYRKIQSNKIREQIYFSNSHFYSSEAYERRRVSKHKYHNRMSASVFPCCLCTTVSHKENFSSIFWFSSSLSNSAIALCRLSHHLHTPGLVPTIGEKKDGWKPLCWYLRFPSTSTGFSSLTWIISRRRSIEYLILSSQEAQSIQPWMTEITRLRVALTQLFI